MKSAHSTLGLKQFGWTGFKRICLLSLAGLLAVSPGTVSDVRAAEAIPEVRQFTVKDGDNTQSFAVAMDRLYVKTKGEDGVVTQIGQQGTLADVIAKMGAHKKNNDTQVMLMVEETGKAVDPTRVRTLSRKVLVQLAEGVDDKALAAKVGASSKGRISYAPQYCFFESPLPHGALVVSAALKGQPGVISAEPQVSRDMVKRLSPNDTLFPQQWHLFNSGQLGAVATIDINVTNVWNTYRGNGTRILIVDDGLQMNHPDLAANVDATFGYDFRDNDSDPSPTDPSDAHGVSVAGIAAARGNNGLGVSGVAFESRISGVRLIGPGTVTLDEEAQALSYSNMVFQVSNNSWGPSDDGSVYPLPSLTEAAFVNGTTTGRGGRGVIYVWAGGNGGLGDNSNLDGYANSIYTIAVGALNDQGVRASYSEQGANLVVSAPSGRDSTRPQGSTTTDITGNSGYSPGPGDLADADYTQLFNGTSSAAPVVTGVVALLLEANPNLGWRDVQEILIRSARKINPLDPGWTVNSAGYNFHHDYGAGMVNVQAGVNMALGWTNLPAQVSSISTLTGLALPIPDNNIAGVTVQFNISDTALRAEHVTLNVDIPHTFRADLEIVLTSPTGTQSRMVERRGFDPGSYNNFRFMTVRHWGERAAGTWTLRVSDRAGNDVGTLASARLQVFGTDVFPSTPGLSIGDVTVLEGNTGVTNAVFSVNMYPPAAVPVTVAYTTVSLTATAGSDFVATNGILTFAAGTTNQTITVAVNGDQAIEQNEQFRVTINSSTPGVLITDGAALGSILDDDLGAFPDLVITPTTNVLQLVSSVIATNTGFIVRGAQLKAHNGGGFTSSGTFQLVGPSPHTYGLTLPGLVISSGHVDDYETGPDLQPGNTTAFGVAADAGQEALLDTITGGIWDHNDVTQLDIYFDVVPGSNNVTFQVVFGSEEYPDFVGSPFVDGFGIFLNGTNIAFESGLPININHPSFSALIGTELNGVMAPAGRAVLTFSALVAPNSTNNVLTFIVADTTDDILDTTVFVSSLAAVQPPPIPVANILDAPAVIEGSGVTNIVNFPVQLSLVSTQQVSVAYLVANGRAKRGEDYIGTSGRIIFPPNVTNQVISVPIIGDLIDEPEEGFTVVIFSPSNAFVGRAQAFTTIVDDDAQAAKISISDAVVTEGNSGTTDLTFHIRLSEPSGHVVTANYGTAPGTAAVGLDYLPQSGTLAFEPGETDKTFVVKVVGDLIHEGDETFFLNLSSSAFATIDDNQGQATITDNDAVPTLSVADVSVTEGDSGAASMVFTVKLSNPTSSSVTVDYAAIDGTATLADGDYLSSSGTLTIPPGQAQATVTVVVNGDLVEEPNETVILDLSNPNGAAAGDMQAIGTIANDDGPHLSIVGVRVQEGAVGTTTDAVFTVNLVKPDASTVTVEYEVIAGSAAAGVDYVTGAGLLTFPDGTISLPITVVVNGDALSETNETFTVRLKNINRGTIAVSDAQGVIVDDDTAANLGIGITLPVTNIYVGHPFTLVLKMTNQGTYGATNAVIEHVLPAGFQLLSGAFGSVTGTVGQVDGTVRGVIPVLANGSSAELSLQVVGSGAAVTTFGATVSSDQFDDVLADNEASVDQELLEPVVFVVKEGSLLVSENLLPANRGLDSGETVTMSFALKNTGKIATTNLVAILRNENGVSTSEPAKVYGSVAAGGTGVARDFVFSVQGAGGSTVSPVLDLYDLTAIGSNSLGSITFDFQLAESSTVTSGSPITIPAVGSAAVYPATANISGLQGRVAKVTVQINGITHGFPDDLDILLVAPNGKGVILMSDAGAGIDLVGVNLTFADSATLSLPDTAKINSGQYKPTNHGGGDTFAGAPSGPYGTQLESFIGIVPNGDWQLYIVDDGAGDGGNITSWSLSIETTIPADPVAELAVSGSSTPNPVFVGQNFFYTITVTNGGPAAASNLRLTSVLANGVTLVNSIPAVSSSAGSELIFNLGNLAVGASQVVVIEAVSSASGTPTNLVSVVSDQLDLQNQNNAVAIGIRVNRVTMLSSAGVSAPGGPFALSILGQPGLTYVIEVSTNLVNWTPIFTNTTLDGVLNLTDTGAAGAGQRFYRAVER